MKSMKKWILALLALVLLATPLAACAGSSSSDSTLGSGGVVAPAPSSSKPGAPAPTIIVSQSPPGGGKYGSDGEEAAYGNFAPAETGRMIIRNGDISLLVDNVLEARDSISVLAAGFGGYVVSSQVTGEEEGMRGWLSIRIPAEQFDQAMSEMRKLAVKVISENTSSKDVTEEYIDLEGRLSNAEATEKQYLELLSRAATVEEILKVYDALASTRALIEQLKGQMQYYERTAAMAYISVYLAPSVSGKPVVGGWSALEVFKSALRGIVTVAQWLASAAIWLLIFSPVWGGILALVFWQMRRRRRNATTIVASAGPESDRK